MVAPLPDPDPAAPLSRGWGCVAVGALFVFVAIIGWLLAIMLYGLVVEQWALIEVRREFSYDWVFLYAPMFAIGCATAAAFVVARRASAARLTLLIVVTGAAALIGGLVLFGFGVF
ncbi:hypothetical protein [Sphingopyxis sp.]|uniref:hypothetical protein n=1 Tax=Sphingopyxis sp. TaxID=1908224 RepID=UPI003D0BF1A6